MSNNIAKVWCMPRFMTSWPSTFTISLASHLRLRSKQSAMYCYCSVVKWFFLCLLTNKGSTKRGGGLEQTFQLGHNSTKNAPKTRGQGHLILDYLEHILYTPFDLEWFLNRRSYWPGNHWSLHFMRGTYLKFRCNYQYAWMEGVHNRYSGNSIYVLV